MKIIAAPLGLPDNGRVGRGAYILGLLWCGVCLADGARLEGPLEYRGSGVELEGKRWFWSQIGALHEKPLEPAALHARYEKQRAAAPRTAAGQFGLGRWCSERGREQQARAAFRTAIELEPDHPGARRALGYTRVASAWQDARQVLQQRAQSVKTHDQRVKLADWCREHGLADEERKRLVAVLAADSFHRGAIRRMERILARRTPRTAMAPPFSGRWIAWVDSTRHHKAKVFALFAIDFLQVDERGVPWRGRRAQALADYHGFGATVHAAAAGRVIQAEGRHPDLPPRRLGASARANSVTLDHGNGEFTFYGHLKQGSVKVQVGQQVAQGQAIGQVGNSGKSGTPHLHFTLMIAAYDAGGRGVYLSVPYAFRGFELVQAGRTRCKIEVVQARPQEGWIMVCPAQRR